MAVRPLGLARRDGRCPRMCTYAAAPSRWALPAASAYAMPWCSRCAATAGGTYALSSDGGLAELAGDG